MTKAEILTFIEEMESIGDIWTEEQVADTYGNDSLEDALKDRKSLLGMFFDNIGKIINRG